MRLELFYNPRLLCERLADISKEHRRRKLLRGTPASGLQASTIDSLEALKILGPIEPRVIYDIGANAGTWSLLAKAIFPEARIHAFEPLARHATMFKHNTRELRGVSLHEVALGSVSEQKELHITSFSDASSLLHLTSSGKARFNLQEANKTTVMVEVLDTFVSIHALEMPDLLKLDVQGFELEVLKGSGKCLEAATAVLTEVSFQEFYAGQCLFHEVAGALADSGFHLCAFGHGTVIDQVIAQTDVLFVKQGALPMLA